MKTINRFANLKNVFFALCCAGLSSISFAGEFYEKDGVAINGFDTVAYFTTGKATTGKDEFKEVYKGSTFLFATAANRDLFKVSPDKYAPQYNGYCAYGVAKGAKAKTEGEAFKIVDGKLYLNYDNSVKKDWEKKQQDYIATADKNWQRVSTSEKIQR